MSDSSGYELYIYKNRRFEKEAINFHGTTRGDVLFQAFATLLEGIEQYTQQDLTILKWISHQTWDIQEYNLFTDNHETVNPTTALELDQLFGNMSDRAGYIESITGFNQEKIYSVLVKLEFLFNWSCENPKLLAHLLYSHLAGFYKSFNKNLEAEWLYNYTETLENLEFAKIYNVFIKANAQLLWVNDGNSPKEYLALVKALLDSFKYAYQQGDVMIEYRIEQFNTFITKQEVLSALT